MTTTLKKENNPMQIFELNCRLTCRLVLLLIICLFLWACGASDVSNEERDYWASMTVEDAYETTRDIDVTQDQDCNDDGNTNDPEPFTNVGADIMITVNDTGLPIRVLSYTVDFLPLQSVDDAGNPIMPPPLSSYSGPNLNSDWIDTGTSYTISGITVLTVSTKAEYFLKWSGLNFVSLYTISVTLSIVDEEGFHFSLVVDEQVNLSFYDNC